MTPTQCRRVARSIALQIAAVWTVIGDDEGVEMWTAQAKVYKNQPIAPTEGDISDLNDCLMEAQDHVMNNMED